MPGTTQTFPGAPDKWPPAQNINKKSGEQWYWQ